ncbi:bifunctional phosphopantothenoylcysteine decarboxylase/phosphopantothenate--cysteine ligase CoaBC [Methyloligella sp. 2.7D]|uniref:bifunctional phosphopantothenoylcysteine decarboxylase/phosphopantothenate--cysteine ligase CoaBC n=1 Tax=unclassified Methyloligella TaxID=2625955 RepID=UPI00157C7395|nr:bifunctional phosphopantothenoylcysteine decarboxylase/phosphopantothenate--cysteine ligase CoaBC [Methyloligella sp. GL2]QKP78907.1 bifunctional phosphopantothenoylcysteine decarboxylase/phosphopantothenate--cysteine ligase CoaBC [Methyloligella sp. GL2]
MQEKRITIIVGGGIAAFRVLDLVRRLRERGAVTRCILTEAGKQFVTPLSLATLSGNKVYSDLFDLEEEAEIGHIRLARDTDLMLVMPATADLMAKMAHGQANDLATAVLLATTAPVLIAPAMNVRMWEHKATRRNVAQLKDDGCRFVGPQQGDMACGEFGFGRIADTPEIVAAVENLLKGDAGPLTGKRVLITAGPTHEPIDPVRYIANRSSGKQGYALARAAAALGAEVTLISGPTDQAPPEGVTLVPVETAQEMLDAVIAADPADIALMAAAVADWRVASQSEQKMKKAPGQESHELGLIRNPDILATLAKSPNRPKLLIGFAAETEHVVENALKKRSAKGADWIVANDVSPNTGIMGGENTRIHLVSAEGVEDWQPMSKEEMAESLLRRAAGALSGLSQAAE